MISPRVTGLRAASLIALAVTVAVTFGCKRTYRQCSSDSDCPRGETCFKSDGLEFYPATVCARACKSNADCPEGQECWLFFHHGRVNNVPICTSWQLEDDGEPSFSGVPVP